MDTRPAPEGSPFAEGFQPIVTQPVFCRRCQESLTVTDSRCPRCGHAIDVQEANAFQPHRTYDNVRFWLPGLTLALVSGVLSYAICLQTGELGFGLFVAVPLSVGAILGYSVRCYIWVLSFLTLMVTVGIVFFLVSLHFAGFFCGLTLVLIFTGPAMVGMFLGWTLRILLKSSRWDQRSFLPIVLFLSLPYATQALECAFESEHEVIEVRTSLTLDATPAEVWDALMFYEEVGVEPPMLLGWVLPRPLGTTGDKTQTGQLVRCEYDRGRIVKRIREVSPNQELAFDVVEQELHFERDVQLIDGAFRIKPLDDRRTVVTLSTRYQRKLAPQAIWQPIETRVVRSLHTHVLHGIQRQVECRNNHRTGSRREI